MGRVRLGAFLVRGDARRARYVLISRAGNAEENADERWRMVDTISATIPPKPVDRGGIEPPTHGFSVHCSTN